jgi:lipid A 3-O-deacylase
MKIKLMRHFIGLGLLAVCNAVFAQTTRPAICESHDDEPLFFHRYPGVVNVYLENDLFANRDQDYTSGFKVAWVSPNLSDFSSDRCLPPWLRAASRYLTRLHPGPKNDQYDRRNVVFTLGQAMYTPGDRTRKDLIVNDRPYAGLATLGFAYNARNDWQMDTFEINMGMVGPASGARQAQNAIHRLRKFELFEGWDNQIPNEFAFLATYERKRKWFQTPISRGLDYDLITHAGVSLGNVRTSLNAGGEARIGFNIPDDFGTSPIRPAGDNNAPHPSAKPFDPRTTGAHLFASVDARAVARDISLDGTLFSDSHSVKKKPFVADASVGVAFNYSGMKLGFSRVFRTREFVGQPKTPRFGSVTFSLEY